MHPIIGSLKFNLSRSDSDVGFCMSNKMSVLKPKSCFKTKKKLS